MAMSRSASAAATSASRLMRAISGRPILVMYSFLSRTSLSVKLTTSSPILFMSAAHVDRMRSTCAADMNKMGLDVVSFTLKEVRDKNEYITNMGRPDIARIKRDAEVAAAEADRDIAIKRAESQRAAAVAKAQADQERVAAETASLAKQAEAE